MKLFEEAVILGWPGALSGEAECEAVERAHTGRHGGHDRTLKFSWARHA